VVAVSNILEVFTPIPGEDEPNLTSRFFSWVFQPPTREGFLNFSHTPLKLNGRIPNMTLSERSSARFLWGIFVQKCLGSIWGRDSHPQDISLFPRLGCCVFGAVQKMVKIPLKKNEHANSI